MGKNNAEGERSVACKNLGASSCGQGRAEKDPSPLDASNTASLLQRIRSAFQAQCEAQLTQAKELD